MTGDPLAHPQPVKQVESAEIDAETEGADDQELDEAFALSGLLAREGEETR